MAVLIKMRDELRAELASVSTAVSDLFTRKSNVTVGLEPWGGEPVIASSISSSPTRPENSASQQVQPEGVSPVQQPSNTVITESSQPISTSQETGSESHFNRDLSTVTAAYREHVEGLDGQSLA